MSDEPKGPPELEALDGALKGIRFEPRASLGPELLGRLRHGEMGGTPVRPWYRRRTLIGVAASLLVAAGTALLVRSPSPLLIDRCCYDLDGGGTADDGVILLAQRDAKVERLRVYEDRDRTGTFSAGDVVRLDRGGQPAMPGDLSAGLVTIQHCCLDFDGGGPDDDALLVIGVPPDRVMMAAIYERRTGASRGRHPADAFQLR